MKNRYLSIIVVLIVAAIIVVIILDYSAKRPDRLGQNPYEYNVDEYKDVDPELVGYRETRNYPIRGFYPAALELFDNMLYITGEGNLQVITTDGIQKMRMDVVGAPSCIEVTDKYIYLGFENHVKQYDQDGKLVSEWDTPGEKCVFTSLAASDDYLFVADAGNRRVLRYDHEGELLGSFEGKAESSAGHGFIVPSANFDLLVNAYGELWVTNPGKHAIENYTYEGQLRGYWEKSSMEIDGFSGCCNPADIASTADGDFVTCEKGMVRIKIYNSSGELKTVVAPPEKFEEEGKAPEAVIDDKGVIYALDLDRNVIRIFEPKAL